MPGHPTPGTPGLVAREGRAPGPGMGRLTSVSAPREGSVRFRPLGRGRSIAPRVLALQRFFAAGRVFTVDAEGPVRTLSRAVNLRAGASSRPNATEKVRSSILGRAAWRRIVFAVGAGGSQGGSGGTAIPDARTGSGGQASGGATGLGGVVVSGGGAGSGGQAGGGGRIGSGGSTGGPDALVWDGGNGGASRLTVSPGSYPTSDRSAAAT